MQTDELRAELAELAREVDPFPEDLAAIRRRVARRRVAGASIAVVLVVGLIAGVVATTRSDGDHVRVAGHPKQITIEKLPRIDALVAFPARATDADIASVKGILDSSDPVVQYATLPPNFFAVFGVGNDNPQVSPNLRSFARIYGRSLILGVELDRSVAHAMQQLAIAVGKGAAVKDLGSLKGRAPYDDVEIFMQVKACAAQIDAVRTAVERDPDVESFQFFSKEDALNEFKKLFHDEPVLIEGTTADALPTSFRLKLRYGVLPWPLATRYEHLSGVRGVMTPANPFAHNDTSTNPYNEDRSICTP